MTLDLLWKTEGFLEKGLEKSSHSKLVRYNVFGSMLRSLFMTPKRDMSDPTIEKNIEKGFVDLTPGGPLVLLRDTERSLRSKTIEVITPLLPEDLAHNLEEASLLAEESLNELAEIDLDEITDEELKPVRIQMGLLFIGFGALSMAFLMLLLYTLHPELSTGEQIHQFWYQYVWFLGLGVSGLFMLGREAMRP
jgi:hypothetical protein